MKTKWWRIVKLHLYLQQIQMMMRCISLRRQLKERKYSLEPLYIFFVSFLLLL